MWQKVTPVERQKETRSYKSLQSDDEIIYLNNSQKVYTRGGEPHHSKPGRGVGVP